jgi:hypothetical protein
MILAIRRSFRRAPRARWPRSHVDPESHEQAKQQALAAYWACVGRTFSSETGGLASGPDPPPERDPTDEHELKKRAAVARYMAWLTAQRVGDTPATPGSKT